MGKRAQQKTETRRRLKEKALLLYADGGGDKVRPADIATAAGVAQGTFYVHFTNRAELVDELVGDLNRDLNGVLLQTLAGGSEGNLRDAATIMLDAMLTFYQSRIGLFGLYTDYLTRHGPKALVGANTAIVAALMAAAQRYGHAEVTPLDGEILGHSIMAIWRQFVFRSVDIQSRKARVRGIATLVRLTEAMVEEVIPGAFDLDTPSLLEAIAGVVAAPALA